MPEALSRQLPTGPIVMGSTTGSPQRHIHGHNMRMSLPRSVFGAALAHSLDHMVEQRAGRPVSAETPRT